MPSTEDLVGWFFAILIFAVIGLAVWHQVNPKNPISRGLEAFWNTPDVKSVRLFLWKAFWVCFLGFLAISFISWFYEESGWYPRQREVQVFFKAHEWIEGEIQTCYSAAEVTAKKPDAEVTALACSTETESHVLKVTFWGPIKADKGKVWKCERSSTTMTCRLQ
jgi:hypothetical protein